MRSDTNLARVEMDDNSSPILTRAMDLTRVKGVFLDQAVWRLEAENAELQAAIEGGMLEKVRSIKRRIKRAAYNRLYDEEIKRAGQLMTVAEFERRKASILAAPSLMEKIVSASRKELAGTATTPRQATATHGSTSDQADEPTPLRYEDLRDQDDHFRTAGEEIRLDTDDLDEEDINEEESPLEFFEAVRVFMESVGQTRMIELDGEDLHCQKCIDDPTMGEEAARKLWPNATKLRYHQNSAIHSHRQQFTRRIEMQKEKDGAARYQCPYNTECPSYADRVSLMRHIEGSNSSNTSQDHDDAKRADGWYEPDFKSDPAKANPKQVRLVRQSLGWNYSEEKEGEPREVMTVGDAAISEATGPSWEPRPDAYKGMVFGGDEMDINEMMRRPIPELYRDIWKGGDEMEE